MEARVGIEPAYTELQSQILPESGGGSRKETQQNQGLRGCQRSNCFRSFPRVSDLSAPKLRQPASLRPVTSSALPYSVDGTRDPPPPSGRCSGCLLICPLTTARSMTRSLAQDVTIMAYLVMSKTRLTPENVHVAVATF
jgi:hypothetical protein